MNILFKNAHIFGIEMSLFVPSSSSQAAAIVNQFLFVVHWLKLLCKSFYLLKYRYIPSHTLPNDQYLISRYESPAERDPAGDLYTDL